MEPWDEMQEVAARQAQQADRERIEKDLIDAIEMAQRLGLPYAEVKLLKWGCGIAQ